MGCRLQANTPFLKSNRTRAARIGLLSVFLLIPSAFAETASTIPATQAAVPGVRLMQVPESSSVTMLAFNLTAILAVAYLFRRRLIHPAN